LPLALAWATLLATWFGAATILGAAEAARFEGVRGTILDPFASGGAFIVAGLFFARPLWERRLLTIADFYGRVFGTRSELVASVILVPGYFGWIAAQYLALAGIQTTFFGVDPTVDILVAALLIVAYAMIGEIGARPSTQPPRHAQRGGARRSVRARKTPPSHFTQLTSCAVGTDP